MYPPQHAGGYEIAWQQAMRRARDEGHTVRVLTSDYRSGDQREEDPDVHRSLRWYWDLERYEFPRLNLMERLELELHNARELRAHLNVFRPDVVAWWSMGCMSLSLIEQVRRTGIPAAFVVHDDWLDYGWEHDQWLRTWRGRRRGLVAPLAARFCGVATAVDPNGAGRFIFNSRYTLDRGREVRLSTAEACVVHPGIDEAFLEPAPARPWTWRLAYLGRLDRQKGVDTAVQALAQLPPEASLTVWGSGEESYVAEMRELAQRLGVGERVSFRGFIGGEGLRAAFAGADAVVFPVRWNEPFGLVPLEAMGLGRPVVTTARGGTAEFVRDGENALVFPADDAAALAERVKRLAGDEALRSRLLAGGRRTAAQFTATRFARRTVEEILRAAGRVPAEVPEAA
jgi:glycosyltransferase involved in cell wall biosynthesis